MPRVVTKTGHDMKGCRESTVWEQMDGDDVLLSYASAALAGSEKPFNQVHPPTLTKVTTDDRMRTKLENLSFLLYGHSFALTKVRNIRGLVKTVLATFLM